MYFIIKFYAWDDTGRPKFMSKDKTDLGKHAALFYFESMECWHVSGKMLNKKNSYCWLFCKDQGIYCFNHNLCLITYES